LLDKEGVAGITKKGGTVFGEKVYQKNYKEQRNPLKTRGAKEVKILGRLIEVKARSVETR